MHYVIRHLQHHGCKLLTMKQLLTPASFLLVIICVLFVFAKPIVANNEASPINKAPVPKIQVAILLDVSNSMDGLIDQAKAQLWNMVSVMGKAECNTGKPDIEIALYEYGRSSNDAKAGYVKQVSPFTHDLDQLSQSLFNLTTNGGDEYCGQVILTSIQDLQWDTSAANYKVIFIAGNEDFLQGSVSFTEACRAASNKGVIVNTIYCGDKLTGIREHWNLGTECGNGSFTVIDQNTKVEDIATPYDSTLFVLNTKLNGTYISYGYEGDKKMQRQAEVDNKNYAMSKSVAAKRVAVKGFAKTYKNESWDLVDATAQDSTVISKIEMKTLPAEFKDKSKAEVSKIVQQKAKERADIQKQIAQLSTQRQAFVVKEKQKEARLSATATLESEIEKIIRQQATRYNITIN